MWLLLYYFMLWFTQNFILYTNRVNGTIYGISNKWDFEITYVFPLLYRMISSFWTTLRIHNNLHKMAYSFLLFKHNLTIQNPTNGLLSLWQSTISAKTGFPLHSSKGIQAQLDWTGHSPGDFSGHEHQIVPQEKIWKSIRYLSVKSNKAIWSCPV